MRALPLKRFIDPARPITYGIVQAGPDVAGGVPYIRPVDMDGHDGVPDVTALRTTSSEIAEQYRRSAVRPGDLIVSIGPSFGKTMIVPPGLDGANLTQGTARVAPGSNTEVRYLRWATQSLLATGFWNASVGGATFRALNLEPLARTPIPPWPLAEQRAIADFLDTETARIDALIAKKRLLIELLDEQVAAMIEDRLMGQAVEERPLRRLLAVLPQYGASESGEVGSVQQDFPRYIRITDLEVDGQLRQGEIKVLPLAVARPYLLRDGDLLFARSGATVGKAFQYRAAMGAAAFAGYLIRLRVDTGQILPTLIEHWTQTRHYWDQIREASVQATIENVSAERYKEMLFPLPPRSVQTDLVDELSRARKASTRAREALTKQIELLVEHRQALITAAVTGELPVPGVAA